MASPSNRISYAAIDALSRLAEVFERRRQQLAREIGLSDAQCRALLEIGRGGPDFLPSLFARSQQAHPAAVSRTLRQLQEAGLVTVSIASEDARQRAYSPTAKGRRRLDRLRQSRERAIGAVWKGLPRADLEAFTRTSQALAERLERYAREADPAPRGASRPAGTQK